MFGLLLMPPAANGDDAPGDVRPAGGCDPDDGIFWPLLAAAEGAAPLEPLAFEDAELGVSGRS